MKIGDASIGLDAGDPGSEYAQPLIFDRAVERRVMTNRHLSVDLRFWQQY
jgi:hypothetical protein